MKTRKKIAATNKPVRFQKNETRNNRNKKNPTDENLRYDKGLQMNKTLIPLDWLDVLFSKYLGSYFFLFSMSSMFS
jgi:hypothetical protein